MDLIKNIRRSRVKQKEKRSIERDVFKQVSWIVKQYGLNEGFLGLLDRPDEYFAPENAGARMKKQMNSPPFSLATESEYALIMSIIEKVGNPYVQYANSPDEILLSRSLYQLNGSIPEERLTRFHFETLLHHERSRLAILQDATNKA